jgi:glycosyltransferase involved in cell wall biosynthesis
VNGVTELIQDEETGLLVPPRDPQALATAITRLASDRELAQRLGKNARQRVKDLMDGQRMIEAIEELYERLAHREALTTEGDPVAEH